MRTLVPASSGSVNLGQPSHEICGSIHRVELSPPTVIEVKVVVRWGGFIPATLSRGRCRTARGAAGVAGKRGVLKNIIPHFLPRLPKDHSYTNEGLH